MSLLEMSAAGGVLIGGILVVRALAGRYLPRTTFLVLWLLAALRLLLPLTIPLPLPVRIGALLTGVGQMTAAAGPGASLPATADTPVLTVLWLAGGLLLALFFSGSYLRSMRKFRTSLPDTTPSVQAWLAAHRILRPLEVRCSDQIGSPLTYGILRPVILLPKTLDRTGETTLTYVLTHEYIHVRRFDAVTKLLFAAVLCLHWWNPLAWALYVLGNRDLELSCDGQVLRRMGEAHRSGYALALLDIAEARTTAAALCSHFSQHTIAERIEAIMKYRRVSAAAVLLSCVVVAGAAMTFAGGDGSYPVNASGQTYGSAQWADTWEDRPELIAAVGRHGTEGYLCAADLTAGEPTSPAEALARMEQYEALSADWDGQSPIVVRTIPLYDADGRTVIDSFDIAFTPSHL